MIKLCSLNGANYKLNLNQDVLRVLVPIALQMLISMKWISQCMHAVQHTKELFLKMNFKKIFFILIKIHKGISKVIGNQLVFTSSYGGDVSSSIDGIFIVENVDTMTMTLECSFPM